MAEEKHDIYAEGAERRNSDENAVEDGDKASEAEPTLSNNRGVISAKMQKAAGVINQVISGLTAEPIYATYLDFQVNSLHINTSSTSPDQNLLMSFELQKNGSGYANAFTVRIGYCPNPEYGSQYDINYIDSQLESAVTAGGKSYSSRFCTLRYGYSSLNGKQLLTGKYSGMVVDYTCEIQDGMLIYVITGYSSLVYWKENKEAFKLDMPSECKPTEAAKKLVETYMTDYVLQFDEGVEKSDCKAPFTDPMDKNPSRALTEILNQAVHETQSKYLEGQPVSDDKLITYEWFISDELDSSNKGTIYITINTPELDENPTADANIVFDWMGNASGNNSRNIVINFKPEFKGSVRLSLAAEAVNAGLENEVSEDSEGDETEEKKSDSTGENKDSDKNSNAEKMEKSQEVADAIASGNAFLNDDGKLEPIFNSRSPATGGSMKAVVSGLKREKSSWVHDAQYPYKATMTTMGIPYDIPITGRIKVVPLIYGKPHHSQGVYQVLSTADYIDGGGQFTTSWNLMKLMQVKDAAAEAQADAENKSDENQKILEEGSSEDEGITHDIYTEGAQRRESN